MTVVERMDGAIRSSDLLSSKFYQAWSDGTLPMEALKSYAAQYGAFISTIPQGWAAHGDYEVAQVEESHIGMWQRFADSLGAEIATPTNTGIASLVSSAKVLFADPVESLGALYAFEAQQPATAASKLEGLKEHYPTVARGAREYFKVHAADEDEPALLRRRINELPAADQERAAAACETMSRHLRDALDSLYEEEVESVCVQ